MCGTNRLVGLRLYNKNVALRLVGGGLAPFSVVSARDSSKDSPHGLDTSVEGMQ